MMYLEAVHADKLKDIDLVAATIPAPAPVDPTKAEG